MSTTTETGIADYVIATLRAHQDELRRAGIRHVSLFGSVARGDARTDSDVDLVAELAPEARIGLFGLGALERYLTALLGRSVDLVPEPVEKPRLRADIRGMGNRLRHGFDRISLDILWNAVHHDLPGLAADLHRALEKLRAERDDTG